MSKLCAPAPVLTFVADSLRVKVHADRSALGQAAAFYVATHIADMLTRQETVRMVVGSAPSQNEFFESLGLPEISGVVDWRRVEVFHMDEYIGLPADHPQNFRSYQRNHFLNRVRVGTFHEIHGELPDIKSECERLTKKLKAGPIDLVCLGIGENGHLAFNDPPANFSDTEWVKVVELDSVCRQQQVNDGCFSRIEDVPTHAITLSLRVFQEARKLSGVVPAPSKAKAVLDTVEGPVREACPATLLRTHPDAVLFLEPESASLLTNRAS